MIKNKDGFTCSFIYKQGKNKILYKKQKTATGCGRCNQPDLALVLPLHYGDFSCADSSTSLVLGASQTDQIEFSLQKQTNHTCRPTII